MNVDANGTFGATKMLSRFTRDALGRVLTETDYDSAGVEAHSRYQLVYDNRDQVLSQSDRQRQGGDTFTNNTSNWYDATGTLSSTATQSWKDGNSTSNATATYDALWRDSALTQQATLTNTDGSTQSIYAYDNAARLTSVTLTGGQRPRTITLTTDLTGQILTRDESSESALNPHAKSYLFNGVGQGTVNNVGGDLAYAAQRSVAEVARSFQARLWRLQSLLLNDTGQ